jgi:hypothetical protein
MNDTVRKKRWYVIESGMWSTCKIVGPYTSEKKARAVKRWLTESEGSRWFVETQTYIWGFFVDDKSHPNHARQRINDETGEVINLQ